VFQKLQARYLRAFVLLCVPLAVAAQQPSQPPHTVRASADATIKAKPDRAEVTVGVYSQAPTAEAASQQNAAATSRVLTALKQAIGDKGQIKTSGFLASPQMQYGKNGGTPKITGYAANNRLTITLDDLALVSKVVDTAIGAGATQIQGVSFSLKDDEAVRVQALAQASRKAYDAAQAIAKALNLTAAGVLEAQTSSQPPAPVPMFRAAQSIVANEAAETTPIEPGDIEIHATVMVTLEVH
jgi:hypothetical protein